MNKGNVVLGTLAGLTAGAIAGLLFAPKKGTLTRKQIMEKGDGYVGDLKSSANHLYETLSEKLKRTKKHASAVADIEKAKIEKAQEEAKNAKERIKTISPQM